ncbi:MAG: phage holin family protein [Thermoplasmata archaeon]|nr:phage holin family protein [Thermoplasmata archaeon]
MDCPMRYTYCEDCEDAFARSMLEGDRCIYCGSQNTKKVSAGGGLFYYLGYGLLLAGAAIIIFFEDGNLKWAAFTIFLTVGFILSVQGKSRLKQKAVKMGKGEA